MPKDEYRTIEIVPHNPEWQNIFAQEAALIQEVMGELIAKTHHIGSTAIPTIKAKPVIDMIPEVSDITQVDSFNQAMEKLGYKAYGEYGLFGRRFFVKFNEQGERIVNAHIYQTGNPEIVQHLLFLEYMNTHPTEALAYSNLKETLAAKFPHDIDGYCNGKDLFVKEILAKAGFNEVYMREARMNNEWSKTRYFRQKYFFVQIADPYEWTFNHQSHKHFVLYQGGEIIGYAHIQLWPDSRAILRIMVIDEPKQNTGLGGHFMALMEKWLQASGISSLHADSRASSLRFYQKQGYSEMPINDPEGYESDPSDIAVGKML
jgi:GrpB-like predicted nucleotidyltransferase (UPF0157 family)/GNAT superfamily N-acetyltransferase